MGYVEIFRISMAHEYFGTAAAPLALRPADGRKFDRDGFLLRQIGGQTVVIAEEGADLPDQIDLLVQGDGAFLFSVTQGANWKRLPVLDLPLGTDSATLDADAQTIDAPGGKLPLALVRDPGQTRRIAVQFRSVATYWAYHVIGRQSDADLEVADPEDRVSFEDLGMTQLPDGTRAKVLRSRDALPVRARPAERLSLQRPGAFGPVTLVPILPAAVTSFRQIADGNAEKRLQSEIYVTLT